MKAIEFTFNERKSAQTAARLLELNGGEMNYLALMKLLYLADRKALLQLGMPITGDRVVAMRHGPVLSRVFDLVSQKKQTLPQSEWHKFIPRPGSYTYTVRFSGVPETDELSEAEVAVLDGVFAEFRSYDQWALVDFTHKLPEWQDPQETSVPISFEEILRKEKVSEETIADLAEQADADRAMDSILARVA